MRNISRRSCCVLLTPRILKDTPLRKATCFYIAISSLASQPGMAPSFIRATSLDAVRDHQIMYVAGAYLHHISSHPFTPVEYYVYVASHEIHVTNIGSSKVYISSVSIPTPVNHSKHTCATLDEKTRAKQNHPFHSITRQ